MNTPDSLNNSKPLMGREVEGLLDQYFIKFIRETSLPHAIFDINKKHIVRSNEHFITYFNVQKDESISINPFQHPYAPTQQPNGKDSYDFIKSQFRISRQNGCQTVKWYGIDKNEDERIAYITITQIFEKYPNFVKVLIIDITEDLMSTTVKNQLIEAENRYEAIVQSQSEFIVRWKKDGVRTFVNPAYCSYFGLTHEQALNTSFFELIEESDRQRMIESFETLTYDNPTREGVHKVIRKDGSVGYNHWIDTAIFDENKELIEYQSVGRDVTELILQAEQLEEAKKQLFQLEHITSIGKLSSGISHDFKNVLTVLKTYITEFLGENSRSQWETVSLNEMLDATVYAETLVNRLLTFGKRLETKPMIYEVNDLINDFSTMLKWALGSQVSLILNLDPQPLYINIDKIQFQQILLNLAINTKEAIQGNGQFKITTTFYDESNNSSPRVTMIIEDNGKGIPPDVQDLIFEPFFTTKQEGTGLGLSTVNNIVRDHHGSITLESSAIIGTKFIISFPFSVSPS